MTKEQKLNTIVELWKDWEPRHEPQLEPQNRYDWNKVDKFIHEYLMCSHPHLLDFKSSMSEPSQDIHAEIKKKFMEI